MKGSGRLINLCFWSCHDFFKMSSLCHFLLKHQLVMKHHQRKGISLCFSHTKNQKFSTFYTGIIAICKKVTCFFRHPVNLQKLHLRHLSRCLKINLLLIFISSTLSFILQICFSSKFCLLFTSSIYIQMHISLILIMEANALKVSKSAKIRNPYNQVPHLTQDTNGKVTNS